MGFRLMHETKEGTGIYCKKVKLGPSIAKNPETNERVLSVTIIFTTRGGEELPAVVLPVDLAALLVATVTHSMDALLGVLDKTDPQEAVKLRERMLDILSQVRATKDQTVDELLADW